MKVIAIATVTAGGKTTIANELRIKLQIRKLCILTIILLKVKLIIFMNGRNKEQIIMYGI